jgi:Domain of unknown function (DUF4157)
VTVVVGVGEDSMPEYEWERRPRDARAEPVTTRAEPVTTQGEQVATRAEPTDDQLRALATGRPDAMTHDAALTMQHHAGNAAVTRSIQRAIAPVPQRSKVHDVVERPSGRPIPADIARTVESSYGPLPADARMHTDSAALDSAREVGAYAYASGRDIVIPEDAPRVIQLEEAFHLAQQRVHSDVAHEDLGTGVLVSDDNDAYEQEAQGLARQHAGP